MVPADGCTLEEQPRLINLTMTSWSKLFRREFLTGLGWSVSAGGIHEDIPVTCAALLGAGRDRRGRGGLRHRYRRERKGSRDGDNQLLASSRCSTLTTGSSNCWPAVTRSLYQPVSDGLRAAIFERAIWHYTTVLQTTGIGVGRVGLPGLVPRAERHRFFRRMHEDFPSGTGLPVISIRPERGEPSSGWSKVARTDVLHARAA